LVAPLKPIQIDVQRQEGSRVLIGMDVEFVA
jgi:hypothetical protein